MKDREKRETIELLTSVAGELMPKLPYHNFRHVIDVYANVGAFASLDKMDSDEKFLLETSALFHDIIFVPGFTKNEEMSAMFAEKYLPHLGYSSEQVQMVGELILATKMPHNPQDYLAKLLCDADLANLGRDDFFKLGEQMRLELGLPEGRSWYEQQLEFLKEHKYHTETARRIWNSGKAKNIRKLEKLVV